MYIVGITNEKLSSQRLFQIMNMTAESGLCQIKLVGSFAVVQQRGQCDKFVKSINIHNKSAPFKLKMLHLQKTYFRKKPI